MKRCAIEAAMKIALSDTDLSHADDSPLDGCALRGFMPCDCTLDAVAKFLRWHCVMLNGQVDGQVYAEMCAVLRYKVSIPELSFVEQLMCGGV